MFVQSRRAAEPVSSSASMTILPLTMCSPPRIAASSRPLPFGSKSSSLQSAGLVPTAEVIAMPRYLPMRKQVPGPLPKRCVS